MIKRQESIPLIPSVIISATTDSFKLMLGTSHSIGQLVPVAVVFATKATVMPEFMLSEHSKYLNLADLSNLRMYSSRTVTAIPYHTTICLSSCFQNHQLVTFDFRID